MIYARPMSVRKAKYGWDLGTLNLQSVIGLADFMVALQYNFAKTEYILETIGMHSRDLRLYTDNDECANWLRAYFAENQR